MNFSLSAIHYFPSHPPAKQSSFPTNTPELAIK